MAISSWDMDKHMKEVLQQNRMEFLEQLETQVVVQAFPDLHQSTRDRIMQILNNKGNFHANIELLEAILRTENFSNKLLKVFDRNYVCTRLATIIRQNQQYNIPARDENDVRRPSRDPSNEVNVGTSVNTNNFSQEDGSSNITLRSVNDQGLKMNPLAEKSSNENVSLEQSNVCENNSGEGTSNHLGESFNPSSNGFNISSVGSKIEEQELEGAVGGVMVENVVSNIPQNTGYNTSPSMLTTEFNLDREQWKTTCTKKYIPEAAVHLESDDIKVEDNIAAQDVSENTSLTSVALPESKNDGQQDIDDDEDSDGSSFYLPSKEMEVLFPSLDCTSENEVLFTEIENLKTELVKPPEDYLGNQHNLFEEVTVEGACNLAIENKIDHFGQIHNEKQNVDNRKKAECSSQTFNKQVSKDKTEVDTDDWAEAHVKQIHAEQHFEEKVTIENADQQTHVKPVYIGGQSNGRNEKDHIDTLDQTTCKEVCQNEHSIIESGPGSSETHIKQVYHDPSRDEQEGLSQGDVRNNHIQENNESGWGSSQTGVKHVYHDSDMEGIEDLSQNGIQNLHIKEKKCESSGESPQFSGIQCQEDLEERQEYMNIHSRNRRMSHGETVENSTQSTIHSRPVTSLSNSCPFTGGQDFELPIQRSCASPLRMKMSAGHNFHKEYKAFLNGIGLFLQRLHLFLPEFF